MNNFTRAEQEPILAIRFALTLAPEAASGFLFQWSKEVTRPYGDRRRLLDLYPRFAEFTEAHAEELGYKHLLRTEAEQKEADKQRKRRNKLAERLLIAQVERNAKTLPPRGIGQSVVEGVHILADLMIKRGEQALPVDEQGETDGE